MKHNKPWHKAEEYKARNKHWYIFKWEIWIALSLVFFIALLNQIPDWVTKPIVDNKGREILDPLISYPLRNDIVYNSVVIFFTVGVSIFIGVFTEIGKFAGKYGSAIFVLVPSLVWLLSDRADNHAEHIVNTSNFLSTLLFWIVIALVVIFLFLTVAKLLMKRKINSSLYRMRIEFYYNYISRLIIVLLNVVIVLMLSFSLINYGVLSLHLADVTPEMKAKDPSLGTHDFASQGFKTFHALIALFFAILMVAIGLSNTFTSDKAVTIEGFSEKYTDTTVDEIEGKMENLLEDREEEVSDA